MHVELQVPLQMRVPVTPMRRFATPMRLKTIESHIKTIKSHLKPIDSHLMEIIKYCKNHEACVRETENNRKEFWSSIKWTLGLSALLYVGMLLDNSGRLSRKK